MKKRFSSIITCIIIIALLICISAIITGLGASRGYAIEINGEPIGYNSIIQDDVHYVPMRMIFENMGSQVFYRGRDCQVLVLTRDGDMIYHGIGQNTMTINGEQRVFDTPSFSQNNETYIPITMVSAALCPDGISYEKRELDIRKYFFNNDYNKVVKDVLDVCKDGAFYPEKFQSYIKYHVNNPGYSIQDVLFRVNLGLDYPFYENINVIEHPYELLVLVNKCYQLPKGFQQYNLVEMNPGYTARDGKEYLLANVAYEPYIQMAEDAKREGLNLKVVSAYRTEDYQRGLYENKLRTTGKVNADNYSARPGHSEHQTGLAVDINSTSGTFEYTAEFKWMQQHAHEYGFILRYPKGKEWITGYSYEPWHYRYVGTDVAKIIYDEGITYEEYYAKYISVNEFR